jgi:hypothetical protein
MDGLILSDWKGDTRRHRIEIGCRVSRQGHYDEAGECEENGDS